MHNALVVLISLVVGLVSAVISMALMLAITMPFAGVLIRYRANYTPKTGTVRLDDEAGPGIAPRTDPSIGYFGMMKRVHRLEGWAGLYKGTMPTIVASLIVVAPFTLLAALQYSHGRIIIIPDHSSIVRSIVYLGMSLIPALLFVPLQIIYNRAITTPHRLAAFDARTALRVLLSPAERAQPLRLYLAPGVAFAILLKSLVSPALMILRAATSWLPGGFALGGAIPVVLLTTAILTPLEVLVARLSLQRRDGAPVVEVDAAAVPPPPVYSEEPVMEFRGTGESADFDGGKEPYTGLLDCARKIVAEEGWVVLTRAWWLTVVLLLLGGLSQELAPPRAPHLSGPVCKMGCGGYF
ncbi:hypothetical protein B0H14DRAFT_799430 [Mycena olivaceomarginata]|nr:hypothetical protein B0H14DRAFT_799430 [Mycena olivaceomarginata]